MAYKVTSFGRAGTVKRDLISRANAAKPTLAYELS